VWSVGTDLSVDQIKEGLLTDTRAETAKALKDASEARENAAKIERDNLNLRGQVASLEAKAADASTELAGLQKDASDAKTAQQRVEIDLSNAAARQQRIQTDFAKQQERAANAERALLELQERIKDRHLTTEQRARLVELLKANPKGKINVSCVGGSSPEPCIFASEIVDTLKLGGWDVEFSPCFISVGGIPVGLIIQVRSAEKAPIRAVVLQKALGEIGFAALGELQHSMDEQTVNFIVGAKPPHQ
jgi:hypothetical protein